MAHKCASNLIDFKKVVTMTSLTLSEYTFSYSHKRFIDGHENNNGTLGYEPCVEQRYSVLYVLNMSKQMKREKNYSQQRVYLVVKVKSIQGDFRCNVVSVMKSL